MKWEGFVATGTAMPTMICWLLTTPLFQTQQFSEPAGKSKMTMDAQMDVRAKHVLNVMPQRETKSLLQNLAARSQTNRDHLKVAMIKWIQISFMKIVCMICVCTVAIRQPSAVLFLHIQLLAKRYLAKWNPGELTVSAVSTILFISSNLKYTLQ